MVVLLPRRANNGHDDTLGQLAELIAADDGAERFLAATIRSRSGGRDDQLYVHAKVGIVDDRWLTVGSANLNAHSLLNDTEMNVVTDDPGLARETRLRLWAEHLEVDMEAIADDEPRTVIDDRWRPIAAEQLDRLRSDDAPTHRLLALPGVSRRSRRLLGSARRTWSTTADRADRRSRALRSRGALLVAVTDHAAERFRQRVRGTLDAKTEIASRVAQAHAAGRVESGERGTLLVRDLRAPRPGLRVPVRPKESSSS